MNGAECINCMDETPGPEMAFCTRCQGWYEHIRSLTPEEWADEILSMDRYAAESEADR